ncbi:MULTISPECIES: peptidase [Streptomycetaceae]|uniref:peptidase n=1 Tax=Streptomycetaceae TaxID=2062 RepID=UPI00093F4879|nr:peptidase [Streptomyces sp. CB02056]
MRTTIRGALAALALLPALALSALGAPAASAASPSPSASASGTPAPATKAGTSFLTAVNLSPNQDANVSVSTGDYLYWAFGAAEGQTPTVNLTVGLAPSADRHGPQTWSVEVFDGLRRRQACTAGTQNATAEQSAGSLTLNCTLREVRTWAEPWSGDPLPGTYYVRLSVSDVPQPDLGLASSVQLHVAAKGDADNAQPEGGELKAPLVPPAGGGASTAKAAAPVAQEEHWYTGWFSGWNSRWYWTIGGGFLAALAGILGYRLTRHPRGHRPGHYGAVPSQGSHQSGHYTGSDRP